MRYLKKFNESELYKVNEWDDIILYLDVYELYSLLQFTYGRDFLPDTRDALIEETDSKDSPDHIYDVIKFELENKDKFENFCKNFEHYNAKKDKNDREISKRLSSSEMKNPLPPMRKKTGNPLVDALTRSR